MINMIKAKLNPDYARRICGVGVVFFALSIWSLYDGFIAWPKANNDFAKIRPALMELCKKGMPPELLLAPVKDEPESFLLQKIFETNGSKIPKYLVTELQGMVKSEDKSKEAIKARIAQAQELFEKDVYSKSKITGQYIQAIITLVLSAFAFLSVFKKRNVEYILSDDGFSGSGFGNNVYKWEDVNSVDWGKWIEKGILSVTFKNSIKYTLDGWHFAGIRAFAIEINKHFPSGLECVEPIAVKEKKN